MKRICRKLSMIVPLLLFIAPQAQSKSAKDAFKKHQYDLIIHNSEILLNEYERLDAKGALSKAEKLAAQMYLCPIVLIDVRICGITAVGTGELKPVGEFIESNQEQINNTLQNCRKCRLDVFSSWN